MIALEPDELQEAVRAGALVCPGCGRRHRVVAAPPRYLWAPLRGGQTRTVAQTGLQRLDTYVAVSDGAA